MYYRHVTIESKRFPYVLYIFYKEELLKIQMSS